MSITVNVNGQPLSAFPVEPSYFEALCIAMHLCGQHPRSIFMGQAVAFPGTAMRRTLEHLPPEQLLELPVAEDMQMGMAIGMALDGMLPICIYPRINFLLLATNQLVLHLDKLPIYSNGGYRPKVIIRTAVATADPLDPGPQHLGNFSQMYRELLSMVNVVELTEVDQILPAYEAALQSSASTLLIEHTGLYESR